ncbi:hypothetical protein NQ317_012949 [Molorchus minor]|uniref:TRUD domain-containing protein n=1 Tax=Molorchus minor TaxID=1323400 RepID=A0ABQ9JND4_9CUCU|nr:hypothetical protein NQ317_012949 [Molorchus minor]
MYPRQMRMNPRRGGFNVRGPPPGRGGFNNPIFPPGRGGFDTFIPPGRGGFINQPFPGRGGFNNQPFPGRGGFGPQMYPMRGGFNQEYSRPGNRRGGRSNHMHPGRGGLGNYPGGWDDRFPNRRNNQGKGLMHKQRGNLHQKPKKSVYRHQDQLSENEVGITEYINDLEGFTGIIKARYSDFHVNEINVDGTVAKLTSTNPPTDFGSNVDKKDYKDTEESPLELIPQESWEKMKELVTSENGEPIDLDTENMTKQERTKVHQCVKTYFGQKIVASTITTEKIDRRFEWPDDKGEYVHFLVYKESLDTMDACLKISDCVNMSPANFTYGGVKDKRAKTTQWFCVKRVNPWKLMKRTRPLKNVRLGNYEFKDAPLKLGHLQGNRFKIALRNVTGSDELINQSMQSIKEKGFINYYGLQRFGNDKEVPTYEIGVNLLLGKWKEATQLILKPKTSDDPSEDVSKAKKDLF